MGPGLDRLHPASGTLGGERQGKRMTSYSSVEEKTNSTCDH